ncbi:MAG: DUF58 domain-containing protein, partial [Gammaproteobacteria bacterium]
MSNVSEPTATQSTHPGVTIDLETLLGFQSSQQARHAQANKRSGSFRRGDFRSLFRGQGMTFSEVRPYASGDDARSIDWRVTARRGGQPHTKLFEEEHERPVFLVVDQREHLYDHTLHRHRPQSGKRGVLLCLRELVAANQALYDRWQNPPHASSASSASTRIEGPSGDTLFQAVEALAHAAKPGSHVFIISDFLGFDTHNTPLAHALRHLSQHSNTYIIFLYDLLEAALPKAGIMRFSNLQQHVDVDTRNVTLRQKYHQQFLHRVQHIQQLLSDCALHGLLRGTHRVTDLSLLPTLQHHSWRQNDVNANWDIIQRAAIDWQTVAAE